MVPILAPFTVIRSHDAGINGVDASAEHTNDVSLLAGVNRCHDSPCGRGKAEEKLVRKVKLSMPKCAAVARLPKEREATSAMPLSIPRMEAAMSGEARVAAWRMARARMSCAPMMLLEEDIFLVQLTVGVLSHHKAMW